MSDGQQFDVLILGGGMSYVGAIRAAQLGLKVGLVERDKLGGTCLNRGCIPSKALLETADLLHRVVEQGAEFGLAGHDGISLDYAAGRSTAAPHSSRCSATAASCGAERSQGAGSNTRGCSA